VKGATDKAKGVIKDIAGKVSSYRKLQTEGEVDKIGSAHQLASNMKDAARKSEQ
jgi:uncharacterized protein YjbJ (UPF0337 family)